MSGIILASVGNSYGALPINTDAPAVSGTASLGSVLSSTTGTWTGAPAPAFTYQWQRGASDISGATGSSYVVDTGDITYTLRCKVTATNSLGVDIAYSANTSAIEEPAPTTIGQAYGGGFYGGKIKVSGQHYYLIVAPKAPGEAPKAWLGGVYGTPTGITSAINGPTNTTAMVALSPPSPAAVFTEGLTIGGYSDWYLPAKNELEVLYYFLKPSSNNNWTSGAANANTANANAVYPEPINTPYTATIPAQTSAVGFRSGESNAFGSLYYQTSTEYSGYDSYYQYFSNGYLWHDGKTNNCHARAVRRVPV